LKKSKIFFGTGNKHKVDEVRKILNSHGIEVEHYPLEKLEIQADTLEEVARYSLGVLETEKSIVVEDSGLFINHYNGFPGPYSHYALDTISLTGILKLMKGIKDRTAYFKSVAAYRRGNEIRIFQGIVKGRIAQRIRGAHGFGYDPIFIPDEVSGDQTFGELPLGVKNELSHRARSFEAFGKWFSEDY
jgi:XTP/dITP diphosphohydrolase